MHLTPEEIVRELDNSPMSETKRAEVAYRILRETNLTDELVSNILEEYVSEFKDKDSLRYLSDSLYARRLDSNTGNNECLLHIAWGLIPGGGVLDGYLAEYYYDWAGRVGIPEEKVSKIIIKMQLESDDI